MLAHMSVKLTGFYCGSVTTEPFLKRVISLTDVLNTTYPARYHINYVRSSTGNLAPDLVVGTSGVTLELKKSDSKICR